MEYFYWGGAFLAAGGCEQLRSGQSRFTTDISQCEQKIVSLNPPTYSLKTLTDTCIKIEQGISTQELLARFEDAAL